MCVSVSVSITPQGMNVERRAIAQNVRESSRSVMGYFIFFQFFLPPHGVFFPTQIVFLGYFLKKNGNFSVSTQRIPINFISPESRIPPESRDIKTLQIGCKLPPQDALLPPKIVTKKSSDRDSNSGPLESQSKT